MNEEQRLVQKRLRVLGHAPAQSYDLATAWIDRQGLSESGN